MNRRVADHPVEKQAWRGPVEEMVVVSTWEDHGDLLAVGTMGRSIFGRMDNKTRNVDSPGVHKSLSML